MARGASDATANDGRLRRRLARSDNSAGDSWRALSGEGLLLAVLFAAPWAYGGAPDSARYGLAAATFLGLAAGLPSLQRAFRARDPVDNAGSPAWWHPPLGTRGVALPLLALGQVLCARSVAPIATLEAGLLLAMGFGTCAYWSERATRRTAAWRLATVLLLTCVAQALFGAIQHSVAPGSIYGIGTPLLTMPYGSYVNHNHFAGLMAMGALLAGGLAWGHARHARQATPLAVALGGLALGLSATQLASRSRGGLLALVFGLAVLGACIVWYAPVGSHTPEPGRARTTRRGLRAGALAAGLVLVVGGFAWVVVPPETRAHLLSVFTGAHDTSRGYRVDMAVDTLRLWAGRPLLGWGLGAFPDAFPALKRGHGEMRTTHAESDALEFLAEAGLVGIAALLWLLWLVGQRLRERLGQGHDGRLSGLAAGTLAALAAQGAHLCVDFDLRLPANALAASALLGLAATGRPARRVASHSTAPVLEPAAGSRTRLGAGMVVALIVLAGLAGWRAWGAQAFERQARLPAPRRLPALDHLVSWHPYLAEARRARAQAWLGQVRTTRPEAAARLQRAERDLRASVALRPRWGEAWAELGYVMSLRGEPTAARNAVDRAILYDPTHSGIGVARARVLAQRGETGEALEQLVASMATSQEFRWPQAFALALDITRDPQRLLDFAGADSRRRQDVADALAVSLPSARMQN